MIALVVEVQHITERHEIERELACKAPLGLHAVLTQRVQRGFRNGRERTRRSADRNGRLNFIKTVRDFAFQLFQGFVERQFTMRFVDRAPRFGYVFERKRGGVHAPRAVGQVMRFVD
ncbi:hypothetical protein SDC9_64704 [bioreactor metagenome]|uniref:Uncharacterized protein n=1 Tax=bioreactor metagenome TaxID=1076179 RepID=A0A644XRA0_9ZZZZ